MAEQTSVFRVRMLVAYDGASFHGFAYQNEQTRTVAGALRGSLARFVGDEPAITCAGRTDAGVHAWGQVITFDVPENMRSRLELSRVQHALNRQLGPSIVVREVSEVPSSFDARFSAKARSYRYTVLNQPLPDPFNAHTLWHVEQELDFDSMNEAARCLIGEHDFSSFCRSPGPEVSLVRRVIDARWRQIDQNYLRFDISAQAFCHQMVRSVTGQLVEIGLGKRPIGYMVKILNACDRSGAAAPAPPNGLCLWEVHY